MDLIAMMKPNTQIAIRIYFAGFPDAALNVVKLALQQQGLDAFEMYGGSYGSGMWNESLQSWHLADVIAKTCVTTN